MADSSSMGAYHSTSGEACIADSSSTGSYLSTQGEAWLTVALREHTYVT